MINMGSGPKLMEWANLHDMDGVRKAGPLKPNAKDWQMTWVRSSKANLTSLPSLTSTLSQNFQKTAVISSLS